uniref:Cytochrome P450, family 2, subfamily X, polypeptide 9 n=1 Tax=Periophthalmus magnuspinnatus TaxID=409849 RepID=A0A3B3Z8U8_9GOBI
MVTSVLLLGICLVFIIMHLKSRRPKNFPPGPTALPFLGNMHNLSPSNPLNDIEKLRRVYGNVYSLYMGHRAAVVISGTKALKEALVSKSVDFAGRPQDMFMNDVVEQRGVVLADYGPAWKEHRRFALTTMRNFGMGKQSMEDRILGEIQYTIDFLEKNTGKTLSPNVMFHSISSNVVSLVLFGMRYEHDGPFMTKLVNSFDDVNKTINGPWAFLYDSFHWVRYLPLPFTKAFKARQVWITVKDIIIPIINEHKKNRVPGEPQDFVDCYLDELEKRGDDGSSFCPEELFMFCLSLYGAGTDTISSTLLTGFLYLMTKPHIQERCQKEIDQVLEGKDVFTFEDRHNMPYVQAVIHEIQRTANIVPLSVFHATTKDTQFMGYSIPKGTIIIPNLSSALSEEGQWKFPHEFNPENFLNDKGEFVKPDAFLAFSAGSRVCLGEGLARMELFLILVSLLRRFRFIWPEDAGEPDYELLFGITMTTKPYNMKVELRAAQ